MALKIRSSPFVHINKVCPNVKVQDYLSHCMCQVCHYARQTRLPFPHSSIKTTKAFQLIHLDVWGPYKTPTVTPHNFKAENNYTL